MLAPLIALALVPVAAPETPPPLTVADLRRIDDDIADPGTLDRDDLIEARDALLRTSAARSLTLSIEAFAWRTDALDARGEGVAILIGLRLQPEAWWAAREERRAPGRCSPRPAAAPHSHDPRVTARWSEAVAQVRGCAGAAP